MKLRYLGRTKDYAYKKYAFKDNECDIPAALAEKLLAENPRTFEKVAEEPKAEEPKVKP